MVCVLGTNRYICPPGRYGCYDRFDWLATQHGFSLDLCPIDNVNRSVIVGQLGAMQSFLVQADTDKDRRAAAAIFHKQWRKTCKLELRGLDDFAIEAVTESAQKLLLPPYKRFLEKKEPARAPYRAAVAALQQPVAVAPPQPAQQPVYYQQAQPVQYAPGGPACPPGFQLTAIAAAKPVVPPGGGRPPSRGIASTKPGETFPTSHFVRPCAYCQHAGHAGDTCWKTYPELRALNSH